MLFSYTSAGQSMEDREETAGNESTTTKHDQDDESRKKEFLYGPGRPKSSSESPPSPEIESEAVIFIYPYRDISVPFDSATYTNKVKTLLTLKMANLWDLREEIW